VAESVLYVGLVVHPDGESASIRIPDKSLVILNSFLTNAYSEDSPSGRGLKLANCGTVERNLPYSPKH
jgi:hypothetical protein